jgi:hypothetical protein
MRANPLRPGESLYAGLKRYGLIYLQGEHRPQLLAFALRQETAEGPDAGNLHARSGEEEGDKSGMAGRRFDPTLERADTMDALA